MSQCKVNFVNCQFFSKKRKKRCPQYDANCVNFTAYKEFSEPYNLAQQIGAFEVIATLAPHKNILRQMMTEYPCAWCQAEDANKTMNVIGNSSWYVSGDASYFVLKVNLFRFCQINIICTGVAICDPVYNIETVFHL